MRTRPKLLTALFLGISVQVLCAALSETNTFSNVNLPIPDGITSGVHDIRTLSSDIAFISSVRVRLNISGNFNGDLYGYLRHSSGLTVLLNRSGRATTNRYGYSDSGFNVTLADSATNDIHNYRAVGTPAAGLPLTGTWQPDARYVHPASVTNTSARSAFLSAFNGLDANGTWTLFLADVDAGGTNFLNSWSLEITGNPKITPVVTWTNPAAITYGTPLSATQLNATAGVPGTFTYSPPVGTVLNASNGQILSVTFVPQDTTNYQTVITNVSLNVLKKALTITADNKTKVYGEPLPTFTASYSGFVPGEGPSNLATSVTFSTTATASSPTNAYAITPGGATAPNYAITFVNGTLAVTPAALSVTADNASRTYGVTNPLFTGALTGVQNGDAIGAGYTTAATTNSPTGNYPIVPVLNDPTGKLSNYTVSSTNGTLTITVATLSVVPEDASRVYGRTNPIFNGVLSGVQNGDHINATYITPATTNSPIGSYAIAPVLSDPDGKLANYSVITTNGTLTINAATLTGVADDQTRFYGGTNPIFTVTYNGFVNGEDSNIVSGTLTGTSPADTNSPVGHYPIIVSGQSAPNYTIDYVDGTLTVEPAALLVQAADASRAYGQTNPVFSAAISGFVNGEDTNTLGGTLVVSTIAETNSPIGLYPIVPAGLTSTNYALNFSNATLTVTAYALTVKADDQTRSYGQTNPIFTGVLSGVQNGDHITANFTTFATAGTPAGSYDIVPTLEDPDGRLTNYTVSSTNGTLMITPAIITITADNKSKVFGEALPELTASYTGFVLDEDTNQLTALAVLNTTATATNDVGSYPIMVSGATSSNYTFNYLDGTLTITRSFTAGAISTSTNPAPPGTGVTFTMTVSAVAPGVGTPGGTVTFRIDGNVAGAGVLSNGTATFTLDTLAPGEHSVVAEYAGDANFQGTTNALASPQVITAPIYAGNDTLERYPLQGVKVRTSALLENDSSATNGPVTLLSVDAASAAGGAVVLRDGWVFYEPPSGFTNADSFAYVIQDGGGLMATGLVSIVIKSDRDPPQNVGATQSFVNGSVRVEFQGIPGRTYTIQYAESLETSDWQTLGTSQADAAGSFEFIDTPPNGSPPRFYRSTSP